MNNRIGICLSILSAWFTFYLIPDCDKDSYENSLINKNVIITGASSGLGKEAAIYAAKLGASLVLIARRESLLKETIEECKKVSTNPIANFFYIPFDFNNIEAIDEIMKKSGELLHNRIDYLILNHALILSSEKELTAWVGSDYQMKLVDYTMRVNFLSYVASTNSALTFLEKSAGCLLVVSSMIVEHPAYSLPYAASKGAVNSFFSGLRQELLERESNASVVTMHLGFIGTESCRESIKSMSKASKLDVAKLMSLFKETTPTEGGIQIVRSAISRHPPYVYFPFDQKLKYLRALRALVPDPEYVDSIISKFLLSFVYHKDHISEYLKF